LRLKADIADFTPGVFKAYEIKPRARARDAACELFVLYINPYNAVTPDPAEQLHPGAWKPQFIYYIGNNLLAVPDLASPGVIVYDLYELPPPAPPIPVEDFLKALLLLLALIAAMYAGLELFGPEPTVGPAVPVLASTLTWRATGGEQA
jgi:hypothetical protein